MAGAVALVILGALTIYFAIGVLTLIQCHFERAPADRHWNRYDALYFGIYLALFIWGGGE